MYANHLSMVHECMMIINVDTRRHSGELKKERKQGPPVIKTLRVFFLYSILYLTLCAWMDC